jgi:hypothetical protein
MRDDPQATNESMILCDRIYRRGFLFRIQCKQLSPILLIIFLAGMMISCLNAHSDDKGIIITTDKTEYASGKSPILYTIKNNRKETAYILKCPRAFLELKTASGWSDMSDFCGTSVLERKIEPGKSIFVSLKSKVLPCFPSGDAYKCRIGLGVHFNCTVETTPFVQCNQTEVFHSNEFVIKSNVPK